LVRNVLAAGEFTLRTKGRDYLLERPEIIAPAQALPAFPKYRSLMTAVFGSAERFATMFSVPLRFEPAGFRGD